MRGKVGVFLPFSSTRYHRMLLLKYLWSKFHLKVISCPFSSSRYERQWSEVQLPECLLRKIDRLTVRRQSFKYRLGKQFKNQNNRKKWRNIAEAPQGHLRWVQRGPIGTSTLDVETILNLFNQCSAQRPKIALLTQQMAVFGHKLFSMTPRLSIQ